MLGKILSSTTGVLHDEEESNSFCEGDVRGTEESSTRLDSSRNFAMLSTSMASAEGSREHGRLEKRSASCTGGTIDTFPCEGISCPRFRRQIVGERRGTVCARCFEDIPRSPGLGEGGSSCGLIAEKSNGPLGCFVSVTGT
jgi:hypothetical protein